MVKNAIKGLSSILSGIIILLTAFVLITVRQGWEYDVVLSGSMEPNIHVGSVIIVKPIDPNILQVGDTISFNAPDINTPICHRIIDVIVVDGKKLFKTQGDANEEADLFSPSGNDVNGKALFSIPYTGKLLSARNTGVTRVSILGHSTPLAVILVFIFGAAFIFLIVRDTLDEIIHPGKCMHRKASKAFAVRIERRRKLYKLASIKI